MGARRFVSRLEHSAARLPPLVRARACGACARPVPPNRAPERAQGGRVLGVRCRNAGHMAAKKTPKKPTPEKPSFTLTTRAFENGAEAAGASAVKPGFTSSAEHDLWFALGYPEVGFVADGHPDESDADFDEWCKRCFGTVYGLYPSEVPRAVAVRRLRAQGCEVRQNADGSYTDECGKSQRNYLQSFGLMKSDRARELMLWFATHSKVKKDAVAWFLDHAEETRELLEKQSEGSSPESKSAKAILAKMK